MTNPLNHKIDAEREAQEQCLFAEAHDAVRQRERPNPI